MASYLVQQGDPTNLQGLATKLNIPVGTLLATNPNLANSDFSAGTNVVLPASNTSATNVSTPAAPTSTPATTARQPAKPQAPAITSGAGTGTAGTQNQPAGNIQSQVDAINKQALQIQQQLKSLPADQLNDGGAVRASAADIIPPTPVDTAAADAQVAQTLQGLQTLGQQWTQFQQGEETLNQKFSELTQSTTGPTGQSYNQLQQQLLGINNVMRMSENDIRQEIQAGGGFADESQVQALVASRNKVLELQAQNISDQLNLQSNYVNQQMDYFKTDQQTAENRFQTQFDIQGKILDWQQKVQDTKFNESMKYQQLIDSQSSKAFTTLEQMSKSGVAPTTEQAQWYSHIFNQAGIPLTPDDVINMAKNNVDVEAMKAQYTYYRNLIEANKANQPGAGTFTQTQINKGAANAGMSLDQFAGLPEDAMNAFINRDTEIKNDKKAIDSLADPTKNTAGLTADDVKTQINDSDYPDAVKTYLLDYLSKHTPPPRQKFLGIF